MTHPFRVHIAAQEELREAVAYYDSIGRHLAVAFEADLRRALQVIAVYPLSSPVVGKHSRMRPLTRFPYGVTYTVEDDEVLVLALAHFRRKPFYWEDRG